MTPDPAAIASARFAWEDGLRRLGDDRDDATRRRLIEAVHDELRRRVGQTFTVAQLVGVYQDAGDWFLEVAARAVPRDPAAWDPAVALDAAFALYARSAGRG